MQHYSSHGKTPPQLLLTNRKTAATNLDVYGAYVPTSWKKNIDSSSKSNPLRRRGKKITTRRRKGVGVVVEKNEESRRTFNKNSRNLLTAITHTEILVTLCKTNKQFNKKTKL